MNKILLNKEQILSNVAEVFDYDAMARYLNESNQSILIVLDYIKAREWPLKGRTMNNEDPMTIPIVWALCHAPSSTEISMEYDIHPTKCFPSKYMKSNRNAIQFPIIINKANIKDVSAICGGCMYMVQINKRAYTIFQNNPKYCSIFGLPDDCYDNDFENRMIRQLKEHQQTICWSLTENEYLEKKISPVLQLRFMKSEFLPIKYYPYANYSKNFLRAIFPESKLKNLNRESSYTTGKGIIEDMDYDNSGFRYEEQAEYFIKKRLIVEFIRQILLLNHKDDFSRFETKRPIYETDKYIKTTQKIAQILYDVEKNTDYVINQIFNGLKRRGVINENKINHSRFNVMDVEYVPITYPTNRSGMWDFPCLFVNISWGGIKHGFKTIINYFTLPCYICDRDCSEFKHNKLKYECVCNAIGFIDTEVKMLGDLMIRYDGFRLYSYGVSDIYQLERADYFFSDLEEYSEYQRRNRLKFYRLIEIHHDLARKGKSLDQCEKEILEKWLIGWTRPHLSINKNKRFMTRYESRNWEKKYLEGIHACIDDTVSVLLLLLYQEFVKTISPIQYFKDKSLNDFDNNHSNAGGV